MWVITESSRGWEKHGAIRLLQNRCLCPITKASDKLLWFFLLLQGNYSFLFQFRQWAAKWGVQQLRLHLHPGRASTADRGPADPGKTSDFVQWCVGHCQIQVRGIPTHYFSPVGSAHGGISGAILCRARCWTQWCVGTFQLVRFYDFVRLWSICGAPSRLQNNASLEMWI